jgi:hypothetical protein
LAGAIIFNSINVNAQETNAAIFVGETTAQGWDSHNKNQMSVGMIFSGFGGASIFPGSLYLLSDNDVIDTLITDRDLEGGPSSQI